MKNLSKILFTFVFSLMVVEPAIAAESTVNAETQYVFNIPISSLRIFGHVYGAWLRNVRMWISYI